MRDCIGPLALSLLLLLAIGCSGGRADTVVYSDNITLPKVNYSRPNIDDTVYKAEAEYDAAWYLKWVYGVTRAYIDLLVPRQAFPKGAVYVDKNREIKFDSTAGTWMMGHYGVLTGLYILSIFIAIIIPIIGICFSCGFGPSCYSSSSQNKDEDDLKLRRKVIGSLLLIVGVVLVLGVVVSSLSTAASEQGTRELPVSLEKILDNIKTYFNNVVIELDSLLGKNFSELSSAFIQLLKQTGEYVIDQLAKISEAVALVDLNNIVSGLKNITMDLEMISTTTEDLKTNAIELESQLNTVRTNLEKTFDQCGKPCDEIKAQIQLQEIGVAAEFDKLPIDQINEAYDTVDKLIDSKIVETVQKGLKEFENIEKNVQNTVDTAIPKMTENIDKASKLLSETVEKVSNITNYSINKFIDDDCKPALQNVSVAIDDSSALRLYPSITISFIVFVVAICLLLGSVCTLCDRQPGSNVRAGSFLLTTAVWIIFLVTSLLLVFTSFAMILGVFTERLVCEPLQRPKDNNIIEIVNQLLVINDDSLGFEFPEIKLDEIIGSCNENKPIIKALGIDKVIDTKSWEKLTEKFNINQTMKEIVDEIKLDGNYEFINEKSKKMLGELANSELGTIDFSLFTELLKQNLTGVDLGGLAKQLEAFADQQYVPADIKEDLKKTAADLNTYQTKYIEPMKASINQLASTASELENHIKFNHTSMKEAIDDIIEKVEYAQNKVNTEGPKLIRTIANDFSTELLSLMTGYIDHVQDSVFNEMAKCGPLANIYNVALVSTCDKLLNPFNAYWFVIGWSIVFFFPAIILAIKLNTVLRSHNDYSSSFL